MFMMMDGLSLLMGRVECMMADDADADDIVDAC